MALKTDKNVLKQYFRSGSRPTQKQFYTLIDNCYNEDFTAFASGYHLVVDIGNNNTLKVLKREGGKTVLVPLFERINVLHHRDYHYSIPVSNIGADFVLEKIVLEMELPQNAEYKIKDGRRNVHITQKIKIDHIKIFNGTEEIFSTAPGEKGIDPVHEMAVDKSARQWKGIAIDIGITYDLSSDIAVSDTLDITEKKEETLRHSFGSAGCIFNKRE